MKIIGTDDIVRITNSYNGTNYRSYKDLRVPMLEARQRMHSRWLASLDKSGGSDNGPAYEVYLDPEYNYEALHCFEKSKGCTRETVAFFVDGKPGKRAGEVYDGPPVGELSVLDLYNGNGLTTVHLNMNGFNAESFNDNPEQVKYMQHASKMLTGREVLNHVTLPKKQYDMVLTLEVMEHYSEPLKHLEDLIHLVKPGGYLIESSGFNGSVDNIGHFDSYRLWDWKMAFMKARQLTSKVMKHYFEEVHSGFNAAPRIWRRKLTDPGLPFTPRMAVAKCWEMHPMHCGSGSHVYCVHEGAIWRGDVDTLMDIVNRDLAAKGKPPQQDIFACCSGPWTDIFEKTEY